MRIGAKVPNSFRTTLRVIDSATRIEAVAQFLPRLRDAGPDEVIVDVDWKVAVAAANTYGSLKDGAGR
jgi:hypothetical protein